MCGDDSDSSDEDSCTECSEHQVSEHFPDHQSLMTVLQESKFNWFDFVDQVEAVVRADEKIDTQLEEFRICIPNVFQLNSPEEEALKLLCDAYLASKGDVYADE